MAKQHWPILGIVIAVGLFFVAAAYYPGGTTWDENAVGYHWAQNFISTLFAPTALNGEANAARVYSIPAMLLMCLSLGAVFKLISGKSQPKVHRTLIEIGGIGAAVYGFLAVTPMHNLMINIGLLFGLIALGSLLHLLYLERGWYLFGAGLVAIALLVLSALMYYTNAFYDWLPIMQKASFLACIVWVVIVYYGKFNQNA